MLDLDTVVLTTLIAAATAVWLYRLASNRLSPNFLMSPTPDSADKVPWGW